MTTWVTASMCSPREATSVATRTGSWPSLKSLRMRRRRFWSTSPVSARASQPLRVSRSSSRRASSRVFDEDQDAIAALAAQQPQQQAELLLAADVVEQLLHALGRLLLGHDRDLGGVVHELPRQLEHPEGQRRREEERLALLGRRQLAQDEAQVGDEAHVEHAVGLVDDEHLDLARRPHVLLQVVDQPARACRPGGRSRRPASRAAWRSRCRRRRPGCGTA